MSQLILQTLLLVCSAIPPDDIRVALDCDDTAIVIRGLPNATIIACKKRIAEVDASHLRVQVVASSEQDTDERPPLVGRWHVVAQTLHFKPRFPFAAGVEYRVTVDPPRLLDPAAADSQPRQFTVRMPKKDLTPVAKLTAIYPTADVLPENQLRFYIQFSHPMSRGEAYDRIRLLDAGGKPIDDVFLEIGEELWDPGQTRFTLLFDPGRIKRGLKPREDLGPTLEDGKSYTLVVDGQWRDGEGRALLDKEYRKAFKAGPPDDVPIDPKLWNLIPPAAGSRDALVVKFPEPLDYGLLQRVITVTDEQGRGVPGTIEIGEAEKRWRFTPKNEWHAAGYKLVARNILEDLAANRIGRKFEVDVLTPIPKTEKAEFTSIGFEVRPKR